VLLLAGVCVVFLWEPWHGSVILTFSRGHGLDAGDLPAVPMPALAVALGRGWLDGAIGGGSRSGGWAVPASAIVLGALLLVGGAVARPPSGVPLAPTGGGTFGGRIVSAHAALPNPLHRWTHVAVTYDGATVRLYVDGTMTSSRSTTGAIKRTADPLWLGGNRPYGEYFHGLIDEVHVYDRELRPREVRSVMSMPIAGAPGPSGLVAAYAFDRDRGAVAADASGHGNVGSIAGATWDPRGRFGGALRFRDGGDVVRVPASASLNLMGAMTLAAWVQPTETQSGWRTIIARQTDAYFLMAGGGSSSRDESFGDDLVAALLAGAVLWFCLVQASLGTDKGARRRRSWLPPVALFLAGSVVDALAPSGTLVGPTLVAAWFAATASSKAEAAGLYVVTALFAGLTVTQLVDDRGLGLAFDDDGGIARSVALGLVLVIVGLFAIPFGARRTR
jgi:hypothetical protein